jgi:DNA-directed RNA polymerase, alpha subunit/40 kD subunit
MMYRERRWPLGFLDGFWKHAELPLNEETPATTNDKELTGTVEYVLTVCNLSDREVQILRKHYQQHIPYREIGREYGITGARVNQIIDRAMTKLWQNSLYRGILLHGVAAYARQRYKMRMTSEFERSVKERVTEIRRLEHLCRMNGLHPRHLENDNESGPLTRRSGIIDLGLSARSFNALMRAGRKTISDVLDLKNREALMDIRSLGEKCANEILKTLQCKGFDVAHLL